MHVWYSEATDWSDSQSCKRRGRKELLVSFPNVTFVTFQTLFARGRCAFTPVAQVYKEGSKGLRRAARIWRPASLRVLTLERSWVSLRLKWKEPFAHTKTSLLYVLPMILGWLSCLRRPREVLLPRQSRSRHPYPMLLKGCHEKSLHQASLRWRLVAGRGGRNSTPPPKKAVEINRRMVRV